jgi:signal peptidase I
MRTIGQALESSKIIESSRKKTDSSIISWVKFVILLAAIFFIFRFAIGITIINGNSMNPTLHSENLILTSNIFFTPEKGDLVIVRDPHGYYIVKRVIALPNETIEIKNGIVFLNGAPLKENYVQGEPMDMAQIKVLEGTYFIMGDNRTQGESLDSRNSDMGPISKNQIIAEAIFSILPIRIL